MSCIYYIAHLLIYDKGDNNQQRIDLDIKITTHTQYDVVLVLTCVCQ